MNVIMSCKDIVKLINFTHLQNFNGCLSKIKGPHRSNFAKCGFFNFQLFAVYSELFYVTYASFGGEGSHK